MFILAVIVSFLVFINSISCQNYNNFALSSKIIIPAAANEIFDGTSFAWDDVNNCLYITGSLKSSVNDVNSQVFLMKTNIIGERVWLQTFGFANSGPATGCQLKQSFDKSFVYIVGTIYQNQTSYLQNDVDGFLLKYSTNGTLIYSQIYGEFGRDTALTVVEIPGSDKLYIGGRFNNTRALLSVNKYNGTILQKANFTAIVGQIRHLEIDPLDPTEFLVAGSRLEGPYERPWASYLNLTDFNKPIFYLGTVIAECAGTATRIRLCHDRTCSYGTSSCDNGFGQIFNIIPSIPKSYYWTIPRQLKDLVMFDDPGQTSFMAAMAPYESLVSVTVDKIYSNLYLPSIYEDLSSLSRIVELSNLNGTGFGYGVYGNPLAIRAIQVNVTWSVLPVTSTLLTTTSAYLPFSTIAVFSNNLVSISTLSTVITEIATSTVSALISQSPVISLSNPETSSNSNDSSTIRTTLIVLFTVVGMISIITASYLGYRRNRQSTSKEPQRIMRPKANSYILKEILKNDGGENTKSFNETSMTVGRIINTKYDAPEMEYRKVFFPSDFDMESSVTLSESGKLYKVKAIAKDLKRFGNYIVVKTFATMDSESFYSFQRELFMLQTVSYSKNITCAFGYCTMGMTSILLKYYSMGNLKDWLSRNEDEFLDVSRLMTMIQDVAYGIKVLHGKEIAYCNLDLENVLMEQNEIGGLRCVISNLSQAQTVQTFSYPKYKLSSLFYIAPEVIRHLKYESEITRMNTFSKLPEVKSQLSLLFKRDIYAFAIVMYNILTKRDEIILELNKEISITQFYTLYAE